MLVADESKMSDAPGERPRCCSTAASVRRGTGNFAAAIQPMKSPPTNPAAKRAAIFIFMDSAKCGQGGKERWREGSGASRSFPVSSWVIHSWLILFCRRRNPSRPPQVKTSVCKEAEAENRNEVGLVIAREAVHEEDGTAREKEQRTCKAGASSSLDEAGRRRLKLDVPVHQFDDSPNIILAIPPASQSFGEISGTRRAEAFAAGLAAADRLLILVVKTTH
jgi:hypothetical protein